MFEDENIVTDDSCKREGEYDVENISIEGKDRIKWNKSLLVTIEVKKIFSGEHWEEKNTTFVGTCRMISKFLSEDHKQILSLYSSDFFTQETGKVVTVAHQSNRNEKSSFSLYLSRMKLKAGKQKNLKLWPFTIQLDQELM